MADRNTQKVKLRCGLCQFVADDYGELSAHALDDHDNAYGSATRNAVEVSGEQATAEQTQVSDMPKIAFDFGLDFAALDKLSPTVAGSGGELHPNDVNLIFTALEGRLRSNKKEGETTISKIFRTQYLLDFAWFAASTDVPEELAGTGGCYLKDASDQSGDGIYMSWKEQFDAISTAFASKDLLFTWRRLARALGPELYGLYRNHKAFETYRVSGSPITRAYNIEPQLFYSCLSFFPSMVPRTQWSETEEKAFKYHTEQVMRESTRQTKTIDNLRPDPTDERAERDWRRRGYKSGGGRGGRGTD